MTHDAVDTCAMCGGPIVPFGNFGHRFMAADGSPICTECARRVIPDELALAEEMDRRLSDPGKESQS